MDGDYHPAATREGHPDHLPTHETPGGQHRNYPDHLPIHNPSGDQDRNYLNLPDSPGYLQTIGDRTSLPGSPGYDRTPSSPQYEQGSPHYEQALITPQAEYQDGERRDAPVRLAQAKVVLLGSVAAGKTSLLNALRYGESRLAVEGPDGRTIGIEVHSVALQPDTKLWFYDFGGHDTYHFSQQLFLTQRAIYLLAVDVSIYDPAQFEKTLRHWYTILTSRLVTPVICLLATHIDLCVDREEMGRCCRDMQQQLTQLQEAHQAKLQQELQQLKQEVMADQSDDPDHIRRFQPRTLRQPMQRLNLLLANRPRIFHSVCCISSKTLEGMEDFRQSLVSIVTDNESLFPQKDVPRSWISLSDAIVSMKEDVPFVTMTEFMALGQQFSIVGDHVQRVLSYLQSVGLVLHYQDYRQNSDLSKYVFVNPNLLLAIFGLVFNHNYFMDETRFVWKHKSILRLPHFDFVHLRKNLKERGIIGEKLLKCFWDAMGISDEVYQAIVPLLEKFDLCYEIRIKPGDAVVEGRHFLFPYLLNKRKPPEVNFMWSDDLLDNFMQVGVELSFSQPHLPFGFLEKVLIRAHTYVDHCLSWKQGMVAFCDEGQDLVRIETKTDAEGHAVLTLSSRVRLDRKSMARHIILLLVAVTNRVLLHHYPGVLAYWYCQCAHCLVKSLQQKYSEVKVDRFPADNIVYCSPGDTTLVHCINCAPGHALRLEDIFPRDQENLQGLKRLMSEPCCRALKASAPALLQHINYRDVMNALLRKQLLTIKQAETIGAKPSHEERAQQLLIYMTHTDQKAFDVLCDELKQNDDTAWLAEELLVRAAGRNAKAGKDSDSIGGSSFLRSSKQGWRGSQGSQGSVSNWSTYSRSSYGSTGSYIRRPYGSFITREPVQNYRRSASASSTPQQPRRETAPTHNTHDITAGLTHQADHIRKSRDASVPIPDVKVSGPTADQRTQEDVMRASQRVEPVPAVAYEVEVATTATVQTSAAKPPRPPLQARPTGSTAQYSSATGSTPKYSSPSSYETDIDSYIIPDTAAQRLEIAALPGPTQRADDEADLCSSSITDTVHEHRQNWNHKQLAEYETDIDADIIPQVSPVPQHKANKATHHPEQRQSAHQVEQRQSAHQVEQRQSAHQVEQRQSAHQVEQRQSAHQVEQRQSAHQVEQRQSAHQVEQRQSAHQVEQRQSAHQVEQRQSAHQMEQRQSGHQVEQRQSPHHPEQRQLHQPGRDIYNNRDVSPPFTDRHTVPSPQPPPQAQTQQQPVQQEYPQTPEHGAEHYRQQVSPPPQTSPQHESSLREPSPQHKPSPQYEPQPQHEQHPTPPHVPHPQHMPDTERQHVNQSPHRPNTERQQVTPSPHRPDTERQQVTPSPHRPDTERQQVTPSPHRPDTERQQVTPSPHRPDTERQQVTPSPHRPDTERQQVTPSPHRPDTERQQVTPSPHRPDTERQVTPSPDAASFVYTETDLDAPREQQMPRDMRVRSTGDILGQMQKDTPNLAVGQGSERQPGRESVSSSNIADHGRGRPQMRNAVGLIGSADLGPTHVLQDMDPIELPLRPIKRSRSSSLNKSLRRSKSKSPQAPTPEVRHTWAVPYDWEQHNSMESLSGVGTTKRRSGGFVFAASAIDVRGDTGVNKRTSAPPIFTSQPTLSVEDNQRYSMPRPTGRKISDLPQHEYVEPLPLPESFTVSQSVPLQRRQVGKPPSGLPPPGAPHNQHPVEHKPVHAGQPPSRQPVDDQVFRTHSQPNHAQPPVRQQPTAHSTAGMPPKPFSSRFSDCSDNTESFHTGRSRTGSDDSDNATITSNMSELTFDSYHTTRSHNPSIGSRALSHGSHISAADSFRTARSDANSDIPDDVTITSDVSELTIDSFHTFNSGMTPTNHSLASPNQPDLTMVSQMSNITLDSFQSCKVSDDEVTLTSSPEPPFVADNTPNKKPYRSQPLPQSGPPASRQPLLQHAPVTEENAPPVPPRRDLLNQPPPIPTRPHNGGPAPQQHLPNVGPPPQNRPPNVGPRPQQPPHNVGPPPQQRPPNPGHPPPHPPYNAAPPLQQGLPNAGPPPQHPPYNAGPPPQQWPPNAGSPPQQRPPMRSVTFADEYEEQLKVGLPAARAKQAKTVPLPRTDPQWSPSVQDAPATESGKKDKKKKKADKKSKKTLLPYIGTNPGQDKAVRNQPGNGHALQGQLEVGPGPQYGPNVNNNRPVADVRKEMTQSYVDSIIPESAARRPEVVNQQVYTVHSQPPHPQMPHPQVPHPQMPHPQMPHPQVPHPRTHGAAYQGANQNDHSKPHAYVQPYMRGPQAPGSYMDNANSNNGNKPAGEGQGKRYPYNGGNGNGIVLVEEPYVPTREINANTMPVQPPPQNLTGARNREGQAGDRSSPAASDAAHYTTGPRDTAV